MVVKRAASTIRDIIDVIVRDKTLRFALQTEHYNLVLYILSYGYAATSIKIKGNFKSNSQ
jgi:hypothetical protein